MLSRTRALLLSILFLSLSACTLQIGVDQPTAQVADGSPPAASPPVLPDAATDTPRPDAEETAAPVVGHWLIYVTQPKGAPGPDALWALPDSGGDPVQLWNFVAVGEMLVAPRDLAEGIAPDGQHVAFITQTGEAIGDGLVLRILTVPGGEPVTSIDLLGASVDAAAPAAVAAQTNALTCLDACPDWPTGTSLAWSRDSQRLAFIGAIDGPSADLYVYNVADGTQTRLTDGPSQGTLPIWTPEGTSVVHAGIDVIGQRENVPEYARDIVGISGVYAARPDGSGASLVYTPELSTGEFFLGWHSDVELVSYSWGACGPHDLRLANLAEGTVETLVAESFDAVAYSPQSGMALVTAGDAPEVEGCDRLAAGTWLAAPGAEPRQIVDGAGSDPAWSPQADRFFVMAAESVIAVRTDGQIESYRAPIPFPPIPSLSNAWWIWHNPGYGIGNLMAGPAGGEATVVDSGASVVSWIPFQNRFVTFTGDAIRTAAAPDFTPETWVAGQSFENLSEPGLRRFLPAWSAAPPD